MPGFDRTGPEGQGSQTGRKLGKCNPTRNTDEQSGADVATRGMGMRRGMGRGMARGNQFGKTKGQGNGFGRRSGRNSL